MLRLGLTVVALTVLVVAGCGGRADDVAAGQGLSEDETRWVAGYAKWSEDLADALASEAAARMLVADDVDAYRRATRPLAACDRSAERLVGDGPTARIDGLFARVREVCRLLGGAVDGLASAYATGADPVGALVDSAEALGEANDELSAVGDALDGYSLARRALPVVPWPERRSRIDPELTAAAEVDIEGFDTEVRCWSEAEWERVIDEEQALSNGALSLDSTGAFASLATRVISMQAADCDALGQARAESAWWPDADDDRRDLAWALGVLAHEAQHVAGVRDEAETECRGQQRLADVAVALGAPRSQARRLAELSWSELYPELDEEYTTDLCVDGGPFDLRPGRAAGWPWG